MVKVREGGTWKSGKDELVVDGCVVVGEKAAVGMLVFTTKSHDSYVVPRGEARAAKFFIPLCDTRCHIHEQNHLGTYVSPEAEYNYRCYITIVIESTENAAPVKDFPRRYR